MNRPTNSLRPRLAPSKQSVYRNERNACVVAFVCIVGRTITKKSQKKKKRFLNSRKKIKNITSIVIRKV